MKMRISKSCIGLLGALGLMVTATACSDTYGLPPATTANTVDTVTLYALRGTAISAPSAYSIADGLPSRTDRGDVFDFAFGIDLSGVAKIYPAGALGLPAEPGLQFSDKTFDAIERAPFEDYVVDSVLTVSVGDVFIGRSRNTAGFCLYLGALPRYGKFHILALDPQEKTATIEALVNVNCGYRGLEPGFPSS